MPFTAHGKFLGPGSVLRAVRLTASTLPAACWRLNAQPHSQPRHAHGRTANWGDSLLRCPAAEAVHRLASAGVAGLRRGGRRRRGVLAGAAPASWADESEDDELADDGVLKGDDGEDYYLSRDFDMPAFGVSSEFLEEARAFLIDEEGMDPNDEGALQFALAEFVEQMYSMATEDMVALTDVVQDDLDAETLAAIDWHSDAIAAQAKPPTEGATAAATSADAPPAEDDAEEDEEEEDYPDAQMDMQILQRINERVQPFVDEQLAWEAAARAEGRELPDFSAEGAGGWGVPEDGPLPEGVSAEALQFFEQLQARSMTTEDGVAVGWSPQSAGLPPAVATLVVGLNGWRIGNKLAVPVQMIAANIEGFWRQLFPDLAPTGMDPRWKLVDSVDFNQPGMSWGVADPLLGEPTYPRLVLENRCYETEHFRNLHMELVLRQDGLQVLHCVMWPRVQYDLPILGLDIVIAPSGEVRFVIADPTPVSTDGSLPPLYVDAVRMLRHQFASGLSGDKNMPAWGADIFSDCVVMAKPKKGLEMDSFIMYCVALSRAHLLFARQLLPVDDDRQRDIDAAHRRYCEKQRENKQTRAILLKSFQHLGQSGDLFVERYLREVVFDHEFHYDTDDALKAALKAQNAGKGKAEVDSSALNEAASAGLSAMQAGVAEERLNQEQQSEANRDFFRDT